MRDDIDLCGDAAECGLYLVLKLKRREIFRAQVAETAREQVQEPKLLGREVGHIKVQVKIHDAVRACLDAQRRAACDIYRRRLYRLDITGHIAKLQNRQSREGLLVILTLLPELHFLGGVHHFPTLFVVPCGGLGLAPCLFTLSVVK